ncbi:MAG: sensor histidine kinase [Flavobacteriales bacterium]|nr:sensor histidine kinase [Flavobacteriales bacterium]
MLAGGFLFYRAKQKQQSNLAKIRIEEQQKGLAAVIQIQEEERKRIAKDLHDGIIQQLSGLKLGLQKIFTNKETKKTNKVIKILDDSAQELRELSQKMMPRSLSELGLIPALEDMLDNSLGNTSINFQFEHFGITERFKENVEIAIYRVAQELINNVIKHSKANKVNVQLFKTNNNIILMVEDNGTGLNTSAQKKGIGLMNIASRLDTINGNLNFEPSPKSGTLATVKIPV